jgi:thiol-disulfide isomerase/thioredoxin
MKYLKSLIILFLVSFYSCSDAQSQSYNIDVKIRDLKNVDLYLGYYFGDKTYVQDTIKLDDKGFGTFKGDSLLEQGVYIVILPSKNYFDILIGEDQEFSVETETSDLINNLKIKGSESNTHFRDFRLFMMEKNIRSQQIRKQLENLEDGNDTIDILKNEVEQLTVDVKNYWDKTISENETNLLGVIVKAMRNPEIPEYEVPENIANKDSAQWFYSYNYNRKHYLDNINFADKRYLRTPFFHNKLDTYFTKVLIQNPDTLTKYIDIVASKATDKVVFQYVIQYFINTFQKSNIMGMDKVFVHIAEKYYISGKVDWLSDETMEKLKEQVAKLRFNLIGNIAQNLKMETIDGHYEQLQDITSKFTLVYFFEPDCGHCKKVTPKVYELIQKYDKSDFEVFAVYTQGDKEEWLEYIHDNGFEEWINVWDPYHLTNFRFFYNVYSTPTIYLLDKDKKIIAKRISAESLANILEIELKKL